MYLLWSMISTAPTLSAGFIVIFLFLPCSVKALHSSGIGLALGLMFGFFRVCVLHSPVTGIYVKRVGLVLNVVNVDFCPKVHHAFK